MGDMMYQPFRSRGQLISELLMCIVDTEESSHLSDWRLTFEGSRRLLRCLQVPLHLIWQAKRYLGLDTP